MSGIGSVPVRLRRLTEFQELRNRERLIAQVAAELEIDPDELRAEVAAWEEHWRLYGPETSAERLTRIAAELGIEPAELQAEVDRIMAELEARR